MPFDACGNILGKASYLRRSDAPNRAHLVMVRTVLVTPTRLVISPPQPEPSNSVTRRYANKIDGIIRVQFADEEDKLFVSNRHLERAKGLQVQEGTREFDKQHPDLGLMGRVRRALQHGVVLGGRRFLPVASSSSQQK